MIQKLTGALLIAGALSAAFSASAFGASTKPLPLAKNALTELRFESPRSKLVTTKSVRVTVRVPQRVKSFRAVSGGKVISGRFVRRGDNLVANLPVGKVLRRGVNHVNLVVRTKSGGKAVGDLRLIVAARGKAPASAKVVKQSTRYLAQIKLSAPADHFAVRLNGRSITGRFSPLTTKQQSMPLAPEEGLRFGVNTLTVTAARSNGRFLRRTIRFRATRSRPLASAGRDRRVRAGDSVRLSAKHTLPGSGKLGLRWRVKSTPKGSRATLLHPTSPRPMLKVSRPGEYKIELAASRGGRRGTDVTTVSAQPNVPPLGASVNTLAPQAGGGYAIEVGANCIGGSAACGKIVSPYTADKPVQIMVLDRSTLSLVRTIPLSGSQTDALAAIAILNSLAGTGNQVDYICILGAMPGAEAYPGYKLAVSELTGSTPDLGSNGGWSAIGIPNQNLDSANNVTGMTNSDANPTFGAVTGNLSGYFSFDAVEQIYSFNVSQAREYQTSTAASTATQNTMNIDGVSYQSAPLSAGCTGGFQLVTLRGSTLTPTTTLPVNQTFDSNCSNVGLAEIGLLNLDAAIQAAATASPTGADGPLVVFLQSIGSAFAPSPTTPSIIAASAISEQIESLGGTADTFMTATNKPAGGYALAGGSTFTREAPELTRSLTFAPEASDLQTGSAAMLSGLLSLSRFGHFQPSSGAPTSSRNGALNDIAYQAPTPWPYSSTQSQKNALKYISNHYNIQYSPASSCYKPVTPDVRFEYCDLNAPWSSLLADLPTKAWTSSCGCKKEDWGHLRKQIPAEIRSVQRVYKFVTLVQKIYGTGSGESTYLGVKKIATDVNNAINPPPRSDTGGWWSDLVANVANALSVLAPEDSALEKVSEAVSAIAYLGEDALTTPQGSSTLGQIVKTEAADLPTQSADRYRAASLNFGHFGDIVVTDWGKLSAVAASTTIQLDSNTLAGSSGSMMVGAYRFAYKRMLSVAYDTLSLPPNTNTPSATTAPEYGCEQNPGDPKTLMFPFSSAGPAAWTSMQRNGPSLPVFGNVAPWMLVWGKKGQTSVFGVPTPPQKLVENLFPKITFDANGNPLTLGEYAPWMMRKNFNQVPFPCGM